MKSSVLLPLPEGPSTHTASPRASSSDTPSRMVSVPAPLSYFLERSRTLSTSDACGRRRGLADDLVVDLDRPLRHPSHRVLAPDAARALLAQGLAAVGIVVKRHDRRRQGG